MRSATFLVCAMLAACGSEATALRVEALPPMRESESANTVVPSADHTEPEVPSQTVHALLDGRFEITLPTAIVLTRSQAWHASENLRVYYDSYELEVQQCRMTFAVRSHGLLRPSDVPLRDGETRSFAPAEDAVPHLEIVTTPMRPFEVLDLMHAAVGAVAFEADGAATDFFLWPELAPGEESVVPEGDDWSSNDWYAAQRQDPRLARCYEVAETLLGEALPTLVARRPFAPVQTRLGFGYDEDIDESIAYEGAIPEGWIISTEPAYDASFDDLHRRQAWAWSPAAPSPRARVWMFNGLWPDDEPRPPIGPRRAHLFDHDLRFDREEGDDGSCARVENRNLGLTHTVCLRGTRAEQNELVTILRAFTRVRTSDTDAVSTAQQACTMRIQDADGVTRVRGLPSSQSEIVGSIPNGVAIVPVEHRGRWLRITSPHAGWVFAGNVERDCS